MSNAPGAVFTSAPMQSFLEKRFDPLGNTFAHFFEEEHSSDEWPASRRCRSVSGRVDANLINSAFGGIPSCPWENRALPQVLDENLFDCNEDSPEKLNNRWPDTDEEADARTIRQDDKQIFATTCTDAADIGSIPRSVPRWSPAVHAGAKEFVPGSPASQAWQQQHWAHNQDQKWHGANPVNALDQSPTVSPLFSSSGSFSWESMPTSPPPQPKEFDETSCSGFSISQHSPQSPTKHSPPSTSTTNRRGRGGRGRANANAATVHTAVPETKLAAGNETIVADSLPILLGRFSNDGKPTTCRRSTRQHFELAPDHRNCITSPPSLTQVSQAVELPAGPVASPSTQVRSNEPDFGRQAAFSTSVAVGRIALARAVAVARGEGIV